MALQDKYINPFTDFGFKKLFGTEINKDLLIGFLNQVLPERHIIEDLSYTSNEKLGATEVDRKAIFDLYCVSPDGERFIVEIQKAKQNFFKDRSVYYATFPIQEQALKGDWDYQLSAVYTIGILDFVFEETKVDKKVRHEVKLKDQDCKVFYDKLTFIYLEMPNFNKNESELETEFDKWMYVLKNLPNLQSRPIALQERIFQRLFEAAEIAHFDPQEKAQYEESLKYYRDLNNVVNTSFAEGKEEGIIEIIVKSVQNGLNLNTISIITGKSVEEIKDIKWLDKNKYCF
ncbi:MAG: Rpn family recombination-promoting nuclease/putative transposase [Bacteroidota bacterium]